MVENGRLVTLGQEKVEAKSLQLNPVKHNCKRDKPRIIQVYFFFSRKFNFKDRRNNIRMIGMREKKEDERKVSGDFCLDKNTKATTRGRYS